MNKKTVSLLLIGCIVFIFFSCTQNQAIDHNDVSIRNLNRELRAVKTDDCVDFACKVIEKYYRNMDLGEHNDLSKYVSPEILKLMNTKIELWQFHKKKSWFSL